MNRSPWGRPRNNELIQDLQALALWLLIIVVVCYLLFPNFFQDILDRLKLPEETPAASQPLTTDSQNQFLSDFPLVYQEVYGGGRVPELSKGYWAIFVREGQFEQLQLSEEAYRFLIGLIEKDRTNGSQKLILAASGQVRQVLVSEEVYNVVGQLAVIGGRNRAP